MAVASGYFDTYTSIYVYIWMFWSNEIVCVYCRERKKLSNDMHTEREKEANDSIEIVMVVVIAVHSHLIENVLMYLWIENSLYGWIHLNTPEKYIPNPDCA